MLEDNRVAHQHLNHIRTLESIVQPVNTDTDIDEMLPLPVSGTEEEVVELASSTTVDSTSAPLHRSMRTCRPPSRLIEETIN